MQSMQNGDLKTYLSTLDLEELVIISPKGILENDEETLRARYEKWFEEEFDLRYEVLQIKERNQLAFVLLEVTYHTQKEEAHHEETHYLTIIFDHSEERWRVIFIQYSKEELNDL